MKYFYARVSSKDQNLDRQLELSGDCDRVFTDKQSGKNFERKGYQELKSIVKSGDEVFVKELDRLGRNKEQVKNEIQWFKDNGVILRIMNVPTTMIDFQGQDWIRDMVNNILIEVMSSIAEEERVKIKTRQQEGIAVAKEKGVKFGRPEREMTDVRHEGEGVREYCRRVGISTSMYYRKFAS